MNKSQITLALLLGYTTTITHAMGLSVQLHFGLTENSHQTEADIINNFDEFRAFELVEDYRKQTPYEDTVEGSFNELDYSGTEKYGYEIFIEGDRTGQAWAESTSNVYLLNYELDISNREVNITDQILSGTDLTQVNTPASGTDLTDNFTYTYFNPVAGDNSPINRYKGESIKITATDGLQFTAPTTDGEPAPIYTTMSIYNRPHQAYSSPPDSYVIMSTDNFNNMMAFREELEQTVDSRSGSSLYGQEKFITLDAGLNLSYDVGNMVLQVSAGAHYPLPTADRRSIDIIAYNPTSYLDASFGVLLKYGAGKIGGAIGMSQIRGDFVLQPIKYIDSIGTPYSVDYINHASSYTLGDSTRTIGDINEAVYFAEIRAEGSPITDDGISIYGKYRLGFASDDSTALQKLKVSRDSISVGATLTFYNIS